MAVPDSQRSDAPDRDIPSDSEGRRLPEPRWPWLLATMLAVTMIWSAIYLPDAQPISLSDVDWPDVLGEFSIAVLVVVWLLLIDGLEIPRKAFLFLGAGIVCLFLAEFQDVLDEFFARDLLYPSIVENAGKVGGMLLAGTGMLMLIGHRQAALRKLTADRLKYRTLSVTDSLSGLFNHSHFHAQLETEVELSAASGAPLSLIVIDIDAFKRHNDTFGHLEGDRVIRLVGQILRSDVRASDHAFRYGGEEFTVLLPDTDLSVAVRVAERIRREFEATATSPEQRANGPLTISCGVAELRPKESGRDLLHRADMAMFDAKKGGRNAVVSS